MSVEETNYLAGRFAERCRNLLNRALEARGCKIASINVEENSAVPFSWAAYQAMLEYADMPDHCEGIGLIVGQMLTFNDYGVLGYASVANRTFGESIATSIPFTRLLGWPVRVSLVQVSSGAYRVQLVASDHRPLARAIQEQWLAMCVRGAIRKLPEARISDIQVALTCPKPRHFDIYRACFGGAKVHFDSTVCAWTYPEAWHEWPLNSFDSELGAICLTKLASMERHAPTARSEVEQVQVFLLTRIADGFPTMIETANHLGLSTITLRRRLKNCGTTFEQIVIDLKKDIAVRMLLDPRAKGQEIAYHLGYETPANFYTAFKRWFGCTIKEFRARLSD